MELADAGLRVDLYDRRDCLVAEASAQNEGKVHLGYVYANDSSLRTARTMVRGGLSFAPLLRRWLGSEIDTVPVSAPFKYVVHRSGLLEVDRIQAHLFAAQAIAVEELGGAEPDYFGADPRAAPQRLGDAELDELFDRRAAAAAFSTQEVGIDPENLAELVRRRLDCDERIACLPSRHVRAVDATNGELTVNFETGDAEHSERYDHVVNTLWSDRLTVDRTAGLEPDQDWLFRVKHFLRARTTGVARRVPSTTIVLGPFGDAVSYGDDDLYLSWYPAGMTCSSARITPPEAGTPDADRLRDATVEGLAAVVPEVGRLNGETSYEVKGGVIFAWGDSDIDDPTSLLHDRFAIGPRTHGRYHTIDTGKLTMAPLFGKVVADRIVEMG